RGSRQGVAAACAARGADELRAAKPQEYLLHVIRRQELPGGDVPSGDGTLPRAPRQMQGADQAVFGPGSYAHVWSVGLRAERDKAHGSCRSPPTAAGPAADTPFYPQPS